MPSAIKTTHRRGFAHHKTEWLQGFFGKVKRGISIQWRHFQSIIEAKCCMEHNTLPKLCRIECFHYSPKKKNGYWALFKRSKGESLKHIEDKAMLLSNCHSDSLYLQYICPLVVFILTEHNFLHSNSLQVLHQACVIDLFTCLKKPYYTITYLYDQ